MKWRKLAAITACLSLWALPYSAAQQIVDGRNTDIIHALTNVMVRVNETIRIEESDGRVFSGYVAQDVLDRNKNLIIPRGSNVEMVVRTTSDNELALDLDSIVIFGQRYGLQTEENSGANKGTTECFVGSAGPSPIISAMSGSSVAAINAGACVISGGGVQVLTRGRSIDVPANSLITFQLAQPMRASGPDNP